MAHGLTIREAAKAVGVHKIKWLRYEHGKQSIPAELIPEVARIANTNANYLLAA